MKTISNKIEILLLIVSLKILIVFAIIGLVFARGDLGVIWSLWSDRVLMLGV